MRKLAILITVLASFAACDLTKLEPAQTKAFIKYFGDQGNTIAKDLLRLDDGYLLLGVNDLDNTSVLIKTDLEGNATWTIPYPEFTACSIAKMNDGYFMIGDGIDSRNYSTMAIIKTDLNGKNPQRQDIGNSTIYNPNSKVGIHGTGIKISAIDEVVASFYADTAAIDNFFLYGFDSSLNPTWTSIRKYGLSNVSVTTSRTLEEDTETSSGENEFIWLTYETNGDNLSLKSQRAQRDTEQPADGKTLISERNITGGIGDFCKTDQGGALVQTATEDGLSSIALATYNDNIELMNVLISDVEFDTKRNIVANSITQADDGQLIVLGSITNTLGTTDRTDKDLFITKVGVDGQVGVTGFTNIIGGTGHEDGVAVVQAEDGGYVFLGTMENTNEVSLMMLVKVNSKGELIN